MSDRVCVCGEPIPSEARSTRKYCSRECAVYVAHRNQDERYRKVGAYSRDSNHANGQAAPGTVTMPAAGNQVRRTATDNEVSRAEQGATPGPTTSKQLPLSGPDSDEAA